MFSITRQPRLLIKAPIGLTRLTFALGSSKFSAQAEPLFRSIKPTSTTLMAQASEWQVVTANATADEVNAWDLCHELMRDGLGVAGAGAVEFAEPDIEQRWLFGTESHQALMAASSHDAPQPPDGRLPVGEGLYWFRDQTHSQLELARQEVGQPANRVRIAHFDTGYDPEHITKPQFLRTDLQKNFVDSDRPNNATDESGGLFNNLGHGTGTLGILAGAAVAGDVLGGAAFLDVIPIRVANSVVLFSNSSIAKAFDYVHSLASNPSTQVHVITMSMGGLASQAWADAVNALYDLGIFIVTAAGNNFGNFPTHNIVYPARFRRVIAACGVMADGRPYADLPLKIMAGNYGPKSKMTTALAAYSPNTPWARLGCRQLVDHDGRGTSSATPQIASAAALWIQKFKTNWDTYSKGWMRVEAVRKALGDAARLDSKELSEKLGLGIVQAKAALSQSPAKESALTSQPSDSVSFPFLRAITGLGVTALDARQRMLELEALQLVQQSKELEELISDPDQDVQNLSDVQQRRIIEALVTMPGASLALRHALGDPLRTLKPQITVPTHLPEIEADNLRRAINPFVGSPVTRPLRVFAFDPLIGTRIETMDLNETTIPVNWEELKPGPVGDYFEVVDVDPATSVAYAPVDLDQPLLLSQGGLRPSAANPQFHQQMVYAVAMKTVAHFEQALGRVSFWLPRLVKTDKGIEEHFVSRLRIYPHAIREANAFYSPSKRALLFGYFRASKLSPGENLPGQTVFSCLSHDIVAHETTHALLDGLHPRFREATNPDVHAFHEAFADIVALFQHFTVPEALRDQIARTRGDLNKQSLLGQLAQQFGQGIGRYGSLRDAIGHFDQNGEWQPLVPSPSDYEELTEPHDRGAVLVAAIFEAFLTIYKKRSVDLIRLATAGTGVLPPGDIPRDLVDFLSREASKTASHVLNICIRALDYCPPVDMTFGEYVRALITADLDLVPNDEKGYRIAFMQAFRRRGIYPEFVRDLSTESVRWESPELDLGIDECLKQMSLEWHQHSERKRAWGSSRRNAAILHGFFKRRITDDQAQSLGFYRAENQILKINNEEGKLSRIEIHSVRPLRRVGPDQQVKLDLIVEITQNWLSAGGQRYLGGSTLIIDLESSRVRYVVRKRVGHAERILKQEGFRMALADTSIRSNYFDDTARAREPFALLHRGA